MSCGSSSMSFSKITGIISSLAWWFVTYPAVGEEFHSGYGRDCWGVNRVIFSSEEAKNFRSKVWLKLLFQGTVTWNILSPALRSYTVTTLMWWTRVLFSSSEVNASVYKLYFSGSSVTSFLQSETDCRHRHGAHLPILQGKIAVLLGCQQVPHWLLKPNCFPPETDVQIYKLEMTSLPISSSLQPILFRSSSGWSSSL